MEVFLTLLSLVVGIITTVTISRTDWCEVQRNHCAKRQHIACKPNSFPQNSACKNVSVLPMDANTKALLVHLHNMYRNQIASGFIAHFPQASRMGEMQWDATLQYLAEEHVRHCEFQHDECRATPQYPYSGQNIFYQATTGYVPNATEAIERGVKGWFEEWKIAKPSIVDRVTHNQMAAFHFTVMANDRNNRLGCGIIQYVAMEKSRPHDAFMLTCNYEYNNILDEPLYLKGKPCSQCAKSCSYEYRALCKT